MSVADKGSKSMTTIYLIRHGQASFGAANYDQLSNKGEQQATLLGQYLAKVLKEPPYVYAGTMQRHQQTAQLALAESFPELAVNSDQGWNEFHHQQVFAKFDARFNKPDELKLAILQEKNPRAYLASIFDQAIERWIGNEFDHEYDESWTAFSTRVNGAFDALCADLAELQPRYAVVFSSGGVISTIVGHLLGLDAKSIFQLNWSIANTSITTIRLKGNDRQLLSLNEHHFIKAENAELLTWI